MNILVIDNYDSFTWNLVQPLAADGAVCTVVRNDSITVHDIETSGYDRIIISPGPFGPDRAGVSLEVVRALGHAVPILGVCLGMQAIAAAFGADVVESGSPVHGKQRALVHRGGPLYRGVPNPFEAGLYHSLIVAPHSVPAELQITAESSDGVIMGCRVRGAPVHGVLFHPESFLTPAGVQLLRNFTSEAIWDVE